MLALYRGRGINYPCSCHRAGGVGRSVNLLSGLERDADTSSECPGTAHAKQLQLSGSIPATRILKGAVRRGKGMQCMGVGHGINKCAGLPPALPLFVVTTERGKGVSEVARSLLSRLSAGHCNRAVKKVDRPLIMPHNSSIDPEWIVFLYVKFGGVGLNTKTVVGGHLGNVAPSTQLTLLAAGIEGGEYA